MVKKDEEMSVSSETKGPLKSFQALMGEGEKFSRDKLYTKAIQCYTEALDLLPPDEDKATEKDTIDRLNGLVARSSCYLKIGKNDLSLQDAEQSLKTNKEFTKGLYQKAEALYAMGEFELALMFYHRGKKVRPDLREFQLGINKAQEAIDNSVGDPNRVKLEASGDLSIFYKNDEDESKKKKKQPMGYVRASQKKDTAVQRKQHAPVANPKTTKQILGDLYEDRAFLEKIINNTVVTKANTKTGDAIYQLASEGLDYLDSRTEFWRQQEPLYARSRSIKKLEGDEESYKHIRHELEAIDDQQNKDQFLDARRRGHRLLDFCDRLDERKFAEKQSVLADVYSRLGNAYLELGDYNKSLEYHNRDLKIAETKQFSERSSRALDNLGRVYARSGQFPQAIQVWEKKIPLATSSLEKAWLFHEIGQCHFGLGDYERSKLYGERSFTEAVAVNDTVWQLNAKVLVAHSQTKLRQYREAEQTFVEALALAKDQNDVAAERAIERAMKEAQDQIAKGAADTPPDRTEINYEIKVRSNDNILYGDNDQSTIRLTIYGDNGSSGAIDFRTDENDPKKYDGQSVTFKKKALDAGKMTKITLSCTDIESWPLDSIEVTDSKRKAKHRFLLAAPIDATTTIVDLYLEGSIVSSDATTKDEKKNKTLGTLVSRQSPQTTKRNEPVPPSNRTNDGNKNSKTTKPDEKKSKTPKKDTTTDKKSTPAASTVNEPSSNSNKNIGYTITVQTGSVEFAGTDANVFLSLYGDKNKIVRFQLQKSKNNSNPFERGHKDEFEFENINIGQLKTITIEHDGSTIGAGWYLDFIDVTYNNNTVNFPIDRWLAINENDKRIRLELEPNTKPTSKIAAAVENDKEEKRSSISSMDEKTKVEYSSEKVDYDDFFDNDEDTNVENATEYEITVKTADKRSAGTDANVYISIFGDKGKLERRQLKEAISGKLNLFESGATDRFQVFAADFGKIQRIRIEHDGSGIGSGWYIDSIEVRYVARNETYKFPVDRWLDSGEGDKRISLDLEPDKKPGQLKDENNTDQKGNTEQNRGTTDE
ncbi:unnamed protein product [Rotaria magnacalcarata]|uniref:Outer dynein arm-docking complex subunit 4 n=3 Tax=Rotaria magnacalcarata TaxID=392030 RepID=A0A816XRH0_9BILA|nr:unnamed protein product [Rotaria magnacalcarata]CAF1658904.1 unnamed protein product [Rotaria magnacalcarata]CAF2058546.1 unnamed protein product [Rotaria magnacalcarata]CAF2138274.1 unnamed protein product [Rotaria magnacalcarata]CAF2149908.1 unnamed protein product [Rotaria magnacalcarata]